MSDELGLRREQHDRQRGELRPVAQLGEDVEAVAVGKHDVEQHQVRAPVLAQVARQRLRAVDAAHLVAGHRQPQLAERGLVGVVLDQQDDGLGRRLGERRQVGDALVGEKRARAQQRRAGDDRGLGQALAVLVGERRQQRHRARR